MYRMILPLITLILIILLVINLVKSTRFLILKKDYRSLGIVLLGFILFIFGFVYCLMSRLFFGMIFAIVYISAKSIITCLVVLVKKLMIKQYKVRACLVLLAISIISFGVIFMMYSIRDYLLSAAGKGDLRSIKHLIKNGTSVDINARDKDIFYGHYSTALTRASENGHLEVVKYLVENGADLNRGENVGRGATALMFASQEGHIEVVKYLATKSDINIKDYDGKTALDYAQSTEITEYLKRKAEAK